MESEEPTLVLGSGRKLANLHEDLKEYMREGKESRDEFAKVQNEIFIRINTFDDRIKIIETDLYGKNKQGGGIRDGFVGVKLLAKSFMWIFTLTAVLSAVLFVMWVDKQTRENNEAIEEAIRNSLADIKSSNISK